MGRLATEVWRHLSTLDERRIPFSEPALVGSDDALALDGLAAIGHLLHARIVLPVEFFDALIPFPAEG
jgi:hypothetical protein